MDNAFGSSLNFNHDIMLAALMNMAAKMFELRAKQKNFLMDICSCFNIADINRYENDFARYMGYDIRCISSYEFLKLYLKNGVIESKDCWMTNLGFMGNDTKQVLRFLSKAAYQFLDLSPKDYNLARNDSNQIAAACICMARIFVGFMTPWPDSLKYMTAWEFDNLTPVMSSLLNLMESDHRNIFNETYAKIQNPSEQEWVEIDQYDIGDFITQEGITQGNFGQYDGMNLYHDYNINFMNNYDTTNNGNLNNNDDNFNGGNYTNLGGQSNNNLNMDITCGGEQNFIRQSYNNKELIEIDNDNNDLQSNFQFSNDSPQNSNFLGTRGNINDRVITENQVGTKFVKTSCQNLENQFSFTMFNDYNHRLNQNNSNQQQQAISVSDNSDHSPLSSNLKSPSQDKFTDFRNLDKNF